MKKILMLTGLVVLVISSLLVSQSWARNSSFLFNPPLCRNTGDPNCSSNPEDPKCHWCNSYLKSESSASGAVTLKLRIRQNWINGRVLWEQEVSTTLGIANVQLEEVIPAKFGLGGPGIFLEVVVNEQGKISNPTAIAIFITDVNGQDFADVPIQIWPINRLPGY